jgi:hypothetical protein
VGIHPSIHLHNLSPTTQQSRPPHIRPHPTTGTYTGGAVGLGNTSTSTNSLTTPLRDYGPTTSAAAAATAAGVRIQGFSPRVSILPSKQRPRRLTLRGSDGRAYAFLLKGREDLRQDERVMQLFGLVNALLLAGGRGEQGASGSGGGGWRIARFVVMPLSANSGLIGWVRGCDTLHQVIRCVLYVCLLCVCT